MANFVGPVYTRINCIYPHRLSIQRPPSASRFSVCVYTRLTSFVGSPAIGRVDGIFEPGFPGGIPATASGFLLRDRHAHHSRCWIPCSECWLKTLPSFTYRAGDSADHTMRSMALKSLSVFSSSFFMVTSWACLC